MQEQTPRCLSDPGAHPRPDRNADCRRARGLVRPHQAQRLIAREHEFDGAHDNALERVGDDQPQPGSGRRLRATSGRTEEFSA